MSAFKDHILRVGLILAGFAIGATSLVALTQSGTKQKIADNEKQTLLRAINAVVPANRYDNDVLNDTLVLPATEALHTTEDTIIYRARNQQQPAAVVLTAIAPNGYSGKIKLLIGIYADGSVSGVRVISHKETPGLGDKIDEKKANWVFKFNNRSLKNPAANRWSVKKDGGEFDQFTGATITPRAVVSAIKNALLYFEKNRDQLFAITETE